jgi:hypothetical protein
MWIVHALQDGKTSAKGEPDDNKGELSASKSTLHSGRYELYEHLVRPFHPDFIGSLTFFQ